MKVLITLVILFTAFSCQTQDNILFSEEQFEEQFLTYNPVKKDGVTEKNLNYAKKIISETKTNVDNNVSNFIVADYFNILSAFLTLNESKENTLIVFNKFKTSEGSCEYILHLEKKIEENEKYDLIRKEYLVALSECKSEEIATESFNIDSYCQQHNLQIELIKELMEIQADDVRFRSTNYEDNKEEQIKLDQKNQARIEKLYHQHQTYLGTSLAGPKFENTMWLVIQHSNANMMEKYLPIIHDAYLQGEVNKNTLKLLLDRYYGIISGYQFFGTQGTDLEIASDELVKEIEEKYDL